MIEYIINLPDLIIELFEKDPLYQWLWMLAFAIAVGSKLIKNDRNMIIADIFASASRALHYWVIWAIIATWNNIVAIFRNWASLKWKWNKKVAIFFLIIYTIIAIFWYEQWYSILPTIAAYCFVVGFILLKWIPFRIMAFIWNLSWLLYSVMVNSIWGVLSEIVINTALLITIYRLYKDKNKK